MQTLLTAYQNAYQYFFQPESEVDYTDIPGDVKKYIENYDNGGLTNAEKQDAVNDYNTLDPTYKGFFTKFCMNMSWSNEVRSASIEQIMKKMEEYDGCNNFCNIPEDFEHKKLMPQSSSIGVSYRLKDYNKRSNFASNDEVVEFNDYSSSNISSQSCDVDSDIENLHSQYKKLKHPAVNMKGSSRNVRSLI